MTLPRRRLVRAALLSRAVMPQVAVIGMSAVGGGVFVVRGAGFVGLFVLGLGFATSLIVSAAVASFREARTRGVERDMLARIAYLEKLTSRSEWRAEQSLVKILELLEGSEMRDRVTAIGGSIEEIEVVVKRLAGATRVTAPLVSQRDVELLLVTVLSAATKER